MKKERNILQRLADGADLAGEPLPGQSLVELSSDCRVLIENHSGVVEYSRERIGIGVQFGQVTICGSGLELCRMTREQLIIRGRIDGISLIRR